MNETFQQIGEAIAEASLVTIVFHDRPDGDAIGSSVALGRILESQGKAVELVHATGVPDSLRFLPGIEKVISPSQCSKPDLVISLDSAGKDRIATEVWDALEGARLLINIDHHPSNHRFGDVNWIDSDSPATGQIVFELAAELGWEIDEGSADNLYAAISTDTGSFRYPHTTAKTYRIVAELVDAGADVGRLNQLLYENYPKRRVEALRELLNGLRIEFGSRFASLSLSLELSEKLGLKPGDTEGFIDIVRSIDTVVVAAFFEEMPDGKTRVSSRSKDDNVSVDAICGQFGGGGHKLAAGARLPGPFFEAQERFIAAVGEALG